MLIHLHVLRVAAGLAVLALAGCGKTPAGGSAADGKAALAATVNGEPIRASIVDQLVRQRTEQGAPDSPDGRKQVIEQIALQVVLAKEAEKKGLDKAPETVEQLALIRQSVLAKAYVQDFLKTNPATDQTLQAEYDKLKAEVAGDEYKARHILVAQEATAKDIIAKLKKDPKAFAALAKEKSQDPGSKNQGGDLGWFDARAMVPEFGEALTKLSKGALTETPVKSQFGYHVIVLDDSRPKAFPPFDQVKEQVKGQVQQKSLEKLLADTKAGAKIEMVGDAAAAKATPPAAPATPASPAAAPAETTPAAEPKKK